MRIKQQGLVLAFELRYETLKKDMATTKDILLTKWLPLIPIYARVDSFNNTGKWANFSFRFQLRTEEFEKVLNMLLDILITNYQSIDELGLGCYLSGFEVYINYDISQTVRIKSEQLKLLTDIQTYLDTPSLSISTNSSSYSDIPEAEIAHEDDCGEYYQLFFYTQDDNVKQTIANNWNNLYHSKCKLFQYWGYSENYISLSIKTKKIGELFEWNEIQNDMFAFIKQHKIFIDNYTSEITFAVYNCNYDGGEIGDCIISPLIDLGIDLLITRSLKTPF